jgi:hypothetical protein
MIAAHAGHSLIAQALLSVRATKHLTNFHQKVRNIK